MGDAKLRGSNVEKQVTSSQHECEPESLKSTGTAVRWRSCKQCSALRSVELRDHHCVAALALSWSRELEISDSRISDHLMSRAFHPKYAYTVRLQRIGKYIGIWKMNMYKQERPQWEIIRAFQGVAVVEHNEVPSRASCKQSRYV